MPPYRPLPVFVTPRAKKKLLAQRDYYNERVEGLGDKFYQEMIEALDYVESNYQTPPYVPERNDIKRFVTQGKSFRWLIYFRVKTDKIIVPVIVHPSQRPRY